ncbi:hypothetical protein VIGAN_08254000 [Vigna angularis var. angularis]|uniref:Uncharacterized protein n=1 Tax=Vigna angularis var. angularis TaxID=157739 RepID=A0A0S3SSG3_PHAAN|nr:hypothetical protein VIGAN_08254000 [Vigna angularis var. angularis]
MTFVVLKYVHKLLLCQTTKRHLYANFKKKYPDKSLKGLMWRAATATHPQTWEMKMRNIKELNEEAFKHLIVIPSRFVFIT